MRMTAAAIAIGVLLAPGIAQASEQASDQASEAETRIAKAFAELGMEQDQSACYGSVIVEKLGETGSDKAADIVELAETSSDVRKGVKQSNAEIASAFLAASNRCGR